ncbi:HTH-type transcriptional regulator CysL [Sporomusa rhizae]|uniref:LysR family transcriptional regulator n=1 Tax=Sporomusa rhizae TaxID=357999 RepID=UPI003529F232
MIDVKLETFIKVASVKNYSRAANLLNMTQPAISNQIKMLEEYYNVKLIEKNNNVMELTAAGSILYKYAIEMVRLSKLAKAHVNNEANIVKRYSVGATLTIGGYVLPSIIGSYKICNKNIEIILQVENTEIIIEKMYRGEIDIGVIEGPFDKKSIAIAEKFKDDELVLVVSPQHEFATKNSVTIEEMLSEKLICRERGSGTRKIFENYLVQQGYNPQSLVPYMEIGDITAIISLVQSGIGITVVSREAVKNLLINHCLKEVPLTEGKILREFNFIYLKNANVEFIEKFMGFCGKYEFNA